MDSLWRSSGPLPPSHSRSPLWTRIQLGPHPTRKERPMKSAMSFSSLPFPRVTDFSRGTSPGCLRTPTVFSGTSGAGLGNVKTESSGERADQGGAEGGPPSKGVLGRRTSWREEAGRSDPLENLDCRSPLTEGRGGRESLH